MMPRRCYLFIDVQEWFFSYPDASERLPSGAVEVYVPRWTKLLEAARQRAAENDADTLVAHVQHEDGPGGPGERDTPYWSLRFQPKGEGEPVFHKKQTRSIFDAQPQLAAELRSKGVQNIVVAGMQSDCCVEAAARSAILEGFHVVVLSGAHATLGDTLQDAQKVSSRVDEELRQAGAQIVTWDHYEW
jgi:nicotinamidase-related amidase